MSRKHLLDTTSFSILIPARAGSKRIPNKNIVTLAGKPLIEYTIETSLEATKSVYVSTDCPDIKRICSRYKDVVVVDRPSQLAEDDSTTNSVIEHFLENYEVETFALVQATSPLLKAAHIRNALIKLEDESYDTVLSGYKTVQFYWSLAGTPLNFDPLSKKRTQDIDDWLVENGALYATNRRSFYKNNNLIGDKVGIIAMSKIDSVDIDDYEDLEMAESTILYRKRKNNK